MVFESEIECSEVDVVSEASDRIQLALESYSADVAPFRPVGARGRASDLSPSRTPD
jgi:hypothetical protein